MVCSRNSRVEKTHVMFRKNVIFTFPLCLLYALLTEFVINSTRLNSDKVDIKQYFNQVSEERILRIPSSCVVKQSENTTLSAASIRR